MPRRRKYDLAKFFEESVRECPHCDEHTSLAFLQRTHGDSVKCPHCGGDFVPESQSGPPMRTS